MAAIKIRSFLQKHHAWLTPAVLYLAGLAIRLLYLKQISGMPTLANPILDERYFMDLARSIISTEGLPAEPFFGGPIYPYFLALLQTIAGDSLTVIRFIQAALGAGLPVLVYLIGRRVASNNVGFWSAAVAVFYPTFLYYDSSLLITSLMVLMTAVLLWQLLRCQERPTPINFAIAGLLLGLAGLTRPNILVVGPLLLIWVWAVIKSDLGWRRTLYRYVLMGAVTLATIAPVTVRNYVVAGDPVLIGWQGGLNFYLGNHSEASGWSAIAPGIERSLQGGARDAVTVARRTEGRELKHSKVSDFWYRKAWSEIVDKPSGYLSLQIRKVRYLINGYEIPNDRDLYVAREFSPLLSLLMFQDGVYFPYGLLAPLALLGAILALNRWRRFLLLYLVAGGYAISLLLFFVCARFRQPIIPILIILAVFGLYEIIQMVRERRWKIVVPVVIVTVIVAVEANHNIIGLDPHLTRAKNQVILGTAYLNNGDLLQAEASFQRAIEADSTYPTGFSALGYLKNMSGDNVGAARNFYKAVELGSMEMETYVNFAQTLQKTGDLEGAVRVMEWGRQRLPLNDNIHLALGIAYMDVGRLPDARASVTESLRLNPGNRLARQVLEELGQGQ